MAINFAAAINPNKPLWEVTAEEFGRVIDVNLKGVHLAIRAFLPGMKLLFRGGSGNTPCAGPDGGEWRF